VVSFADIVHSQCSLDGGAAERTFEQLARTLEDVCRRHGETRALPENAPTDLSRRFLAPRERGSPSWQG